MSNPIQNSEEIGSAFALRSALKQTQSTLAQDRLFQKVGQTIFMQGWSEQTLQLCLDEIALFAGATHGMILQQHAGALKVVAQRGKTFPIGARIPMMGHLAQWLKPPILFDVHAVFIPALWSMTSADEQQTLHFQHLPIAHHQQSAGLLALACPIPVKPEDMPHLNGMCGILGLALKTTQSQQNHLDDSILQKLTPREREVLALLPSGASNAALAEKLDIAPGTVKIHIERILSKLDLKDRTQAAVMAVQMGFKSDGL
jgi:DNA-binding CsgD family transcriptional regulator